MVTLWQKHQRWKDCTLCKLCERRTQVVLAKGSIPCDVLAIGEAAGLSEDTIGIPFVGPAGKLLEQMLGNAGYFVIDHDIAPQRIAYTNVVACIPLNEDDDKLNEPPKESIDACSPRLQEFIELANPKMIICVGQLAQKYVPKLLEKMYGSEKTITKKVSGTSKGSGKDRVSKRSMAIQTASNQHTHKRPTIVNIVHPANILRSDIAVRGLAIQKCIITLRDALEDLTKGE